MTVHLSPRQKRLRNDLRVLQHLKSISSIFNFEARGEPPTSYVLRFNGPGTFRPHGVQVHLLHAHEIAVELHNGYPGQPPQLTWRTPIFHPNISATGNVCLGKYGKHWKPSVAIDELCNMLWDMLRYENFDTESPYNREAAQWAREQREHAFPLDKRPLRDLLASGTVTTATVVAAPVNAAPTSAGKPAAQPKPPVQPRPVVGGAAGNPFVAEDVVFLDDAEPPRVASARDDEIMFIS